MKQNFYFAGGPPLKSSPTLILTIKVLKPNIAVQPLTLNEAYFQKSD